MPTKTETHVHFSNGVDLSEDTKSKLIDLLNARLADTIDMKTQVKHAHWNVKGLQFHQLHLLFDDAAGHVDDAADLIAERAVQLGGVAHGTARIAAKTSSAWRQGNLRRLYRDRARYGQGPVVPRSAYSGLTGPYLNGEARALSLAFSCARTALDVRSLLKSRAAHPC